MTNQTEKVLSNFFSPKYIPPTKNVMGSTRASITFEFRYTTESDQSAVKHNAKQQQKNINM